jgi:hypothetical protein
MNICAPLSYESCRVTLRLYGLSSFVSCQLTVDGNVGTTGWEWSSDENALLPNPGPCVSDPLPVGTVGTSLFEAAKTLAGLDPLFLADSSASFIKQRVSKARKYEISCA